MFMIYWFAMLSLKLLLASHDDRRVKPGDLPVHASDQPVYFSKYMLCFFPFVSFIPNFIIF